jgi:Tfp pilus assembly protein PilV
MATTFTHIVERMDCYPNQEDKTDVVSTIYWRINASNSATAYGSVNVTWKEGDPFTPYEELTHDDVWAWVAAAIDVDAVEKSLEKDPIVSLPLPWSASTVTPNEITGDGIQV